MGGSSLETLNPYTCPGRDMTHTSVLEVSPNMFGSWKQTCNNRVISSTIKFWYDFSMAETWLG